MNESDRGSGSEDEPLVPDDFDDEFFQKLIDKVPEITKALRQKDTQDNADHVQRLLICCNRYKSDWQTEQSNTERLNNEIAQLQERLQSLEQLSRLDQDTIGELRDVIESAWKQKDAAQLREQMAQDEVLKQRDELQTMEEQLKQLSEKRSWQSKRDEDKERTKLNTEIKELNKRLQIQRTYTTEVEGMTQTLEQKNKGLLKLLDETSSEALNSKKQNDALLKELQQLKTDLAKKLELISQTKMQNEQLTKVKVRQNLQILSLKTNLEHLNTQHNATCNKLAKIIVELEYAILARDKNKRELTQRSNLLKVREDDILKLRQENAKLAKSQESTARKYATLDEAKRQAEEQQLRLSTQLRTQEKELESMRRVVRQFSDSNQNLTNERNSLKRNLLHQYQNLNQANEQLHETQHDKRSLKNSVHTMEMRGRKLKEGLREMEKEKTKKTEEVQVLLDRIDALHNKVHLKENHLSELKRNVLELEHQNKRLHAVHNTLLTEKSGLERSLTTAEEDKEKLLKQISLYLGNIDQLKSRVDQKDVEIGKLQLQVDKMEKERRLLRSEIHNTQLDYHHTRAELDDRKKDNDQFSKALQEDALKNARMKHELDNLLNEKNSVISALNKRNEEYTYLKHKMDTMQTAYDRTEKALEQYQNDMRLLQVEIKNLRLERDVLRKDRESASDLRHELLQTHRHLNQERVKARALQEEMVTPMNVHRWRNLGGSDPQKMELIEKIQSLKKLITSKDAALMEKDDSLAKMEQLYASLKEYLAKLPNPDVRAELNKLKSALESKDRQLKALRAELNARQKDEALSSDNLEKLKQILALTKAQLAEERKQRQKLVRQREALIQIQANKLTSPLPQHGSSKIPSIT